jgi:hypothetical protein
MFEVQQRHHQTGGQTRTAGIGDAATGNGRDRTKQVQILDLLAQRIAVETEDFRDESSRAIWDDFSPPSFGFKKGKMDSYNWNSETFSLAGIKRYYGFVGNRIDNPDPAMIQAALMAQARREARGRLKIFLGAAPGVGKTYSMLESAQEKKREGVDVLVGLVETHGRKETQRLLDGLDVIPRKPVEYRGRIFQELDLEAVLARHPKLTAELAESLYGWVGEALRTAIGERFTIDPAKLAAFIKAAAAQTDQILKQNDLYGT